MPEWAKLYRTWLSPLAVCGGGGRIFTSFIKIHFPLPNNYPLSEADSTSNHSSGPHSQSLLLLIELFPHFKNLFCRKYFLTKHIFRSKENWEKKIDFYQNMDDFMTHYKVIKWKWDRLEDLHGVQQRRQSWTPRYILLIPEAKAFFLGGGTSFNL